MIRLAGRILLKRSSERGTRKLASAAAAVEHTPIIPGVEPTQEDRDAILDRPDYSHINKRKTAVVRPVNINEVYLNPRFEDLLETALSKGCSIAADPNYRAVCRGEVSGTKFMNAEKAIAWMEILKDRIQDLKEVTPPNLDVLTSGASDEVISKHLTDDALTTTASTEAFFDAFKFDSSASPPLLAEIVILLLGKNEIAFNFVKYGNLVDYLSQNWDEVIALQWNPLLYLLLKDINESQSLEKRQIFADRVYNVLMQKNPIFAETVHPYILDRVALFSLESNAIDHTIEIMTYLANLLYLSPTAELFKLFISSYLRKVQTEKLNKETILSDLGPLKNLFFHYGLDPNSFELLLSNAIDHSYDLSHLLRLALREDTIYLLAEYAEQVILRLNHINKIRNESAIVKAVHLNLLVRFLFHENKLPVDHKMLLRLRSLYEQLKIPFDETLLQIH